MHFLEHKSKKRKEKDFKKETDKRKGRNQIRKKSNKKMNFKVAFFPKNEIINVKQLQVKLLFFKIKMTIKKSDFYLLFALLFCMLASVKRIRPAFENASLEVSRVFESSDLRDLSQFIGFATLSYVSNSFTTKS